MALLLGVCQLQDVRVYKRERGSLTQQELTRVTHKVGAGGITFPEAAYIPMPGEVITEVRVVEGLGNTDLYITVERA